MQFIDVLCHFMQFLGSNRGADPLSGCSSSIWACFLLGFNRNGAELGYPRREAQTSPRKRPHLEAGAV